MEYSITHVDPFDGKTDSDISYVVMKGEIVPGDYQKLLAFGSANNLALTDAGFILSSPGGDVSEALKIGQLIKSMYVSVAVGPRYDRCASACFILFASAVKRLAEPGLVGIHRPYVARSRLASVSPSDAERLETRALLDAEKYLHDLRVPSHLVEEMFQNASTEIHWLSDSELAELGESPPWYEEFLIARCGLDKRKENRCAREWTASCETSVGSVYKCGNDLTKKDALKNLNSVLPPDQRWIETRGPPPLPPPVAAPTKFSVNDIVVGGCYFGDTDPNYFHVEKIANGMVTYVEHGFATEAIDHRAQWKRGSIGIQQFIKQVGYVCADYFTFPGLGS